MAHEILLNSGDSIDEASIQTALGRESMSGYIDAEALQVTYYDADDTIDVSGGLAYILDNNRDLTIDADAFVGHALVGNAVNHVWLAVDPSAATDDEAVGLVSNSTGVAPSNPSIELAEVDTNQSGSDAVTLENRGTAPSLEGADINPRTIGAATPTQSVDTEDLQVKSAAVQTFLSGYVVAVSAETGVGDAIDPEATTTPIQDASDAINAAGSGGGRILLPTGTVDSPGEITGLGNVSVLGHGNYASTIRITDSAANGIFVGAETGTNVDQQQANGANTYLDGFEISGGDVGARTGGSAIQFSGRHVPAFHIGRVVLKDWGGPDAVIRQLPYSSSWRYIYAANFTGPFVATTEQAVVFDMQIGQIYAGPNDPTTPVVDINNGQVGAQIKGLNCGGSAGKVLRHQDSNRNAWLSVGWINTEPTSHQTISGGAVELNGDRYAEIGHVSTGDVTADSVVELGAHDGSGAGPGVGAGPGRTRLHNIQVGGTSVNNAPIEVTAPYSDPAVAPLFYDGPESNIEFNGHGNGIQTADHAVPRVTGAGFVNGGWAGFPNAQAAIYHAEDFGYRGVVYPPGTYSNINITEPGITVRGTSYPINDAEGVVFDGSANNAHGIRVGGNAVALEHVRGTSTTDSDGIEIIGNNCEVVGCAGTDSGRDGIRARGDGGVIARCVTPGNASAGIHLVSDTANYTVFGNYRVGTLTDDSSANEVFGNSL